MTHWAQVMQERTQSGLSIKAYCKQIGICANTYFYWQRRVRAAAANELGLRVCKDTQPSQVSFSTVRVSETAVCPAGKETGATGQLHIDEGNVRLTADRAYPVEQLTQLLQGLSGPC